MPPETPTEPVPVEESPGGSAERRPSPEALLDAIRRLEARLARGDGPAPAPHGSGPRTDAHGEPLSLPPPPDEPEALRTWIERLHASVVDLARDQREVRRQLSALVAVVEARSFDDAHPFEGPLPPSPAERTPPPEQSRLRAWAKRGLRLTLGTARRLWQAAAPNDWIQERPSPESRPDLTLGWVLIHDSDRLDALLETPSDAHSGDESRLLDAVRQWHADLPGRVEGFAWHRRRGTFRALDPELRPLDSGPATEVDAIRAASRSEVCLPLHLPPSSEQDPSLPDPAIFLPPVGQVRAALAAMAMEDLRFLYLFGARDSHPRSSDLLLARWSWWHPDTGLDPSRAARGEVGRVIGKARSLAPGAAGPRLPQGPGADWLGRLGLRPVGAYWVREESEPYPIDHTLYLGLDAVYLGLDAGRPGSRSTLAVVLGRPMDAVLERLAAAVLRQVADDPGGNARTAVLQLVDEGPGPAHPARNLEILTPWIFELGCLADPLPVGALAARLLLSLGVDRLVHIGPGPGFYDSPEILELLAGDGTQGDGAIRAFDLPTPNGLPIGPPPALPRGVRRLHFETESSDDAEGAREWARRLLQALGDGAPTP